MADVSAGERIRSHRCHLLELPIELQLVIYEYVIIEAGPLLLNLSCNSSYRGRYELAREDKIAWRSGKKRPPLQPALSQTCRTIRAETLPMFYGSHVFRSCYCQGYQVPKAVKWLSMIGCVQPSAKLPFRCLLPLYP